MMLASLTNVVPTLASAFMTRLQVVSVPEHAPVQAANVEPDARLKPSRSKEEESDASVGDCELVGVRTVGEALDAILG